MVKPHGLGRIGRTESRGGHISSPLLLATLAGAPLPSGSVDSAWVAFWCVGLSLALAAATFDLSWSPHLGQVLVPTSVLALCFVLLMWAQTTTLFGKVHPIWPHAQHLLGSDLGARVGVSAVPAWGQLGGPLACVLAFVTAFLVSIDGRRARVLLYAFAAIGACYAAGALATHLLMDSASRPSDQMAFAAPFINRNHAAAYYGSAASVWVILFLSHSQTQSARGRSLGLGPARSLLAPGCGKLALALVGVMITVTATFLTKSRGGVLCTALAIVFSTTLIAIRAAGLGRKLKRISVLLFATVCVAYFAGGFLTQRISTSGFWDDARAAAYRSILRMIADNPLLGTGLGTFKVAFPMYKPAALDSIGVWDYAHSTLLEILVELGLPFAGLCVATLVVALSALLRGVFTRKRDRVLPLSALAVGLLGATHSVIDFPLQIPAYGMSWASLIGLGLAQAVGRSQQVAASAKPVYPNAPRPSTSAELGEAWAWRRRPAGPRNE